MFELNQKGFSQIILIIVLLIGLISGVYLVQQKTNLLPKAFEVKHSLIPSVTVIDDAPPTKIEGVIQNEYPSNDELVQRLLGEKYISADQLTSEFGTNFKSNWTNVVSKYPETIIYELLDNLNHGEKVIQTMIGVWNKLGFYTPGVELIPLQGIFEKGDLILTQDYLGNPGISLNFDHNKIINLLKDDPNKIINLSFQVGEAEAFLEKRKKEIPDPDIPKVYYEKNRAGDPINTERIYLAPDKDVSVGVFVNEDNILIPAISVEGKSQVLNSITEEEYQTLIKARKEEAAEKNAKIVEAENPLIKIVGAYTKEKAEENLSKLFKICKAYPDKLFIAVLGNEQEDIRDALKNLDKERPENLILVAASDTDNNFDPKINAFGADIYVNNNSLNLKIPPKSSFSTAVISAYGAVLFSQEYSLEEVKDRILKASNIETYELDGVIEEAKVFNPQLLTE